ncbi:hypothetical protein [Paraglaciecola marina]|uniref:hypothetical protein n=1 Tax=Paraglaciecola marina TaxID=2500157 RepID=UPI0010607C4C|nr:hypothetical protein [Paraglaciecola marina]
MIIIDKKKTHHILLFSAISLLLLDRPIQYVFYGFIGVELPTNRLLPMLAVMLLFTYPTRFKLKIFDSWVLATTVVSLALGTIFLAEYRFSDVISCVGVIVSFFLGLQLTRIEFSQKLSKVFLFISIVAPTISLIALLGLSSNLQLIEQLHQVNGVIVPRPEIFTDQNFHFIYVFMSIALIYLYRGLNLKKLLVCILIIINLWSLSEVQTRTGVIFFMFTLLFSIFYNRGAGHKSKNKLLYFFIAAMILIALAAAIIVFSENLSIVSRFENSDSDTGLHRIHSFLFWLTHLFDFKYWIPFGNREFDALYGGIPHSNVSAFYVLGGIMALFGYFVLFVRPAFLLLIEFMSKRCRFTMFEKFLCINVFGMFLVQQTLNVPLTEHTWFWAGVGLGLLYNRKKVIQK